jgi:DNA-binding NtrC family response regulator
LGETGTGKELFAKAIHDHSRRRDKPFVAINCGAVPEQLFENELFGHVKGAYTTATARQQGVVAAAQGGTLLLDEVDGLTASNQVKLLRFLQDRMYRTLGCPYAQRADVRILAASNADLGELVERKHFRSDLYHRLNVIPLSIPALRERIEDIPLLAVHFANLYQREFGHPRRCLAPSAIRTLLGYHWPGNVRELEGVIQRSLLMSTNAMLGSEDIALPLKRADLPIEGSLKTAKIRMIQRFEQAYLKNLLTACEGNLTRAARAAGADRRVFQRLVRRYGFERESFTPIHKTYS